jgi:hypothetical protein
MPDRESIIEPIRKTQRRQTRAMVASFVLIALLGGYVAKGATETVDSLCALRTDLEVQVQASEDFLRDHPKGIPGITPGTIQLGIERQRHTITALSPLSCGGSFLGRLLP